MDKISLYKKTKEKGVKWLLAQRNEDGSFVPAQEGMHYFRVPWALAVSGRTAEAASLVEWIRKNMWTDGDFTGKYPRPHGKWGGAFYIYINANIILGAHLLRQFDISIPAMEFLIKNYHDNENGGFFNNIENTGADGEKEICHSSQGGISALMTGHIETARKVAHFLKKVYDAQLELPDRLYIYYSTKKGLITDFNNTPEERRNYVIEAQEPRQMYFAPGIAAAFLVRLYMVTKNIEYLELAKKYQKFAMGCTERQFEVPQVCKTGWGSALLYQVTKEEKYKEWTIRVGDYYVASQFEDGHWENIEPHKEPQIEINVRVTAEFIVHVDNIIGALST